MLPWSASRPGAFLTPAQSSEMFTASSAATTDAQPLSAVSLGLPALPRAASPEQRGCINTGLEQMQLQSLRLEQPLNLEQKSLLTERAQNSARSTLAASPQRPYTLSSAAVSAKQLLQLSSPSAHAPHQRIAPCNDERDLESHMRLMLMMRRRQRQQEVYHNCLQQQQPAHTLSQSVQNGPKCEQLLQLRMECDASGGGSSAEQHTIVVSSDDDLVLSAPAQAEESRCAYGVVDGAQMPSMQSCVEDTQGAPLRSEQLPPHSVVLSAARTFGPSLKIFAYMANSARVSVKELPGLSASHTVSDAKAAIMHAFNLHPAKQVIARCRNVIRD